MIKWRHRCSSVLGEWKVIVPTDYNLWSQIIICRGGGGYSPQSHTWMCLPNLENWTFTIPIFRPITHPSVYLFRWKSTQFCSNLVLLTIICSKYTQVFNLGSFVSDENPPIAIPNFVKKRSKRQAYLRIPSQCENPPRNNLFLQIINLLPQH